MVTTQGINTALGVWASYSCSDAHDVSISFQQRLARYGGRLAPLTTVLPPSVAFGRQDVLAGCTQKKGMQKPSKDSDESKPKKGQQTERSLKWVGWQ